MTRARIFLAAWIVILLTPVYVIMDKDCRNWLFLRIDYPSYVDWKKHGGAFKSEFYGGLNYDRNRNDLIIGMSYVEVREKYTNLYDENDFPANGYKNDFRKGYVRRNPHAKILWLTGNDGFDWCFVIDPAGNTVMLIKG